MGAKVTAKELRARGLCTQCRKSNSRKTNICEACKNEHHAWQTKRREDARNSGKCVKCFKSWTGEEQACADCRKSALAKINARRDRAIMADKCVECKELWNGPSMSCTACKKKERQEWDLRKAKGFCVGCGGVRDGKGYKCAACRNALHEYISAMKQTRESAGVCNGCGTQPPAVPSKRCRICILKQIARNANRDDPNISGWQELDTLFERQGGRCVYTGEVINIGGNARDNPNGTASLDHILATARGGSKKAIENLQWTSWTANRSKMDLTHDELVLFCCKVAAIHGPKTAEVKSSSAIAKRFPGLRKKPGAVSKYANADGGEWVTL